jgi:hypothetical protein
MEPNQAAAGDSESCPVLLSGHRAIADNLAEAGETLAPSVSALISLTSAQVRARAKALAYAKWPDAVKVVTMNVGGPVFKGYRALILAGKRVRMDWRSRKGVGFWATAKGCRVRFGTSLADATLRLAAEVMR